MNPTRWALIATVLATHAAAASAATTNVDCAAGGKIQAALNQASAGDTILVGGVCEENLTVNDEAVRITIDGQGSATIHGPNAAAATVTVLGRNITIRRFTVTGGRQGFSVLRGGSALIEANVIQQTAGAGIIVLQNGHARIVSNTVQLNPNGGIVVEENSFARIGFLDLGGPALANTIRNNRVAGIVVDSASGAWVVGNIIGDNGGPGVVVKGASQATLSGNRIDRNDSDGVSVLRNSSVQLGGEPGILDAPNDTGQVNGGAGLACSLNSSAAGRRGTLDGARGAGIFDTSCTNGLDDLK